MLHNQPSPLLSIKISYPRLDPACSNDLESNCREGGHFFRAGLILIGQTTIWKSQSHSSTPKRKVIAGKFVPAQRPGV